MYMNIAAAEPGRQRENISERSVWFRCRRTDNRRLDVRRYGGRTFVHRPPLDRHLHRLVMRYLYCVRSVYGQVQCKQSGAPQTLRMIHSADVRPDTYYSTEIGA